MTVAAPGKGLRAEPASQRDLSRSAHWKGRKEQASGIDPKRVESLIADRAAARARKDFRESDRIRDELAVMGVVLKDGKDADGKPVTTWEMA